MKFVFTDKKVNLPNYIHNYAEKKVGKLDRFFKEDATAALTFSIEKDRNRPLQTALPYSPGAKSNASSLRGCFCPVSS